MTIKKKYLPYIKWNYLFTEQHRLNAGNFSCIQGDGEYGIGSELAVAKRKPASRGGGTGMPAIRRRELAAR
ncbi:hypothetical protein RBA41_20330 [Massilia sp. CCM 9210]|uniref:hypothetical protein n=1 Tax=Massilia scottii TaxID=3057166 RepID=UPI002796B5F1|nr:hypothetical protein [Massilia sp. CCM 9210]MDQ1815648.1 hypothetical protein [Massilia sp. CCM 9210]